MFSALAGGSIFGVIGSLIEGDQAQKDMDKEADALDQNAHNTIITARYNAARLEMMAGQKIGEMKAGYASSGIEADSGSVLDILRQSHINAEMDRQNILHGAAFKKLQLNLRANDARRGGREARQMSYLNAFSSLFGSTTSASKYGGNSGGNNSNPISVSSSSSGSDYGSSGGSYSSFGDMA